jgi:hypothetical protein
MVAISLLAAQMLFSYANIGKTSLKEKDFDKIDFINIILRSTLMPVVRRKISWINRPRMGRQPSLSMIMNGDRIVSTIPTCKVLNEKTHQ